MIANCELTSLPVDNCFAFHWRLEALPELISQFVPCRKEFYLKHFNDKGDHILVGDDFNITGIIDWELASAEAQEFALSSPCMMWHVGDFYDRKNELSKDEETFAKIFEDKHEHEMAAIARGGRRWQRYLFFSEGLYLRKRRS